MSSYLLFIEAVNFCDSSCGDANKQFLTKKSIVTKKKSRKMVVEIYVVTVLKFKALTDKALKCIFLQNVT